MRYRILPHPKLSSDFINILHFISDYAGHEIGRKKISEIKQTISGLKEYPDIGASRPDIARDLRILPAGEKAVICFTVDDETKVVRIICVTYAGQNWQKIAAGRSED